ncbi:hypothetical protein KL86CLO1_10531 [uncultured Eubacteriales bacterium]|uniref:Uncharacterized protein n=1 Tax=uncultured Eubacteriales bacterium TaxID=172733 RepID=A0A212J564_9FIRM|nr:hypothetical protein KL86CLO1_10531 [uncultured Eubacteriales bacterium]
MSGDQFIPASIQQIDFEVNKKSPPDWSLNTTVGKRF